MTPLEYIENVLKTSPEIPVYRVQIWGEAQKNEYLKSTTV